MSLEGKFIAEVLQRHASRPDVRLFRNHVGDAWHGKLLLIAEYPMHYHLLPGDAVLRGARRIKAGLAPGSADLIGIRAEQGAEACCEPFGRFVSIELKTPGVDEQKNQTAWGRMVTTLHGVHVLARTMDDVDGVLGLP